MKYPVEMGSGTMMHVPKFNKDWFSHSEVDRRDTQIHTHRGDRINIHSFNNDTTALCWALASSSVL
jgi:hypothetical protein